MTGEQKTMNPETDILIADEIAGELHSPGHSSDPTLPGGRYLLCRFGCSRKNSQGETKWVPQALAQGLEGVKKDDRNVRIVLPMSLIQEMGLSKYVRSRLMCRGPKKTG